MHTAPDALTPAQAELAADHVHLVHPIASTLFRDRRLIDEVIDAGYVGLCIAARAYDPDRGASFATYAQARIAGEMRDRARIVRGRRSSVTGEYRRGRYVTSLAAEVVSIDALARPDAVLTTKDGEEAEIVADLRDEVAALAPNLRRVLELSYVEEWSLIEIGAELGVSSARACQLRTAALRQLRDALGVNVDSRSTEDRILAELARGPLSAAPGAVIGRMARRTHATRSHCETTVRSLVARGLVARDVATGSNRIARLELTEAGRRRAAEVDGSLQLAASA